MKKMLPWLCVAAVVAVAGCSDNNSNNSPGISNRMTGVSTAAVTASASSPVVVGQALVGVSGALLKGAAATSVPNPCPTTTSTVLYLIGVGGRTGPHFDAYTDPNHTMAAGSVDETISSNGAGGKTGAITFNNFANCLTGSVTFNLNSASTGGAIQFSHVVTGPNQSIDGTMAFTSTVDASSNITGVTLTTPTGPVTLTSNGQTFSSSVNLTGTLSPTTGQTALSGTVTTVDSSGNTATTTYSTDGSSSTTVVDRNGLKLAAVNVAANGATTVTTYNSDGSVAQSKTYSSAASVNPGDFNA